MTPLGRRIVRLIRAEGPIGVDRYMALALGDPAGGYYATRDPIGAAGDFVTAPEISQVFGELLGLCLAHYWQALGAPAPVRLVELGPGRGTLMADLLRATRGARGFHEALRLHLVEASAVLRARQVEALAGIRASWHGSLEEVPDDAPLLLVANEFLDALPIRQLVPDGEGWRERLVAVDEEGTLGLVTARVPLPPALRRPADPGAVVEVAPAREAVAGEVALRLRDRGGLVLLIDYGDVEIHGDTLQAVRGHARVSPFEAPGATDLTSHVDFGALARVALRAGAAAWGPVPQGILLGRLGAEARLAGLLERALPGQAEALVAGVRRLVEPEAMGTLFKALALTGPDGPAPAGFAGEEKVSA
jgi:SAM-dependent MidA family methyltransferase